ncbi:MAG: thermonuclease family protein [Rhodomicrobiaceae bacterium]
MKFDFSKLMVIAAILLFAGMLWLEDMAFKDEISGTPRVVDGDSLVLNGEKVRLKGIDAPELQQKCEKEGQSWRCGRASTTALRKMIRSQKVDCRGTEFDRHQRLLATCFVNDMNLNKKMVSLGWAVSYGSAYKSEERQAKGQRVGIWQGKFEWPSDWRRKNPRF